MTAAKNAADTLRAARRTVAHLERLSRLQEPDAREALVRLDYRSRRVLELHYGLNGEEPRNLEDIGRTFNVTPERIRQIEVKALEQVEARVEAIVRERAALPRRVLDLERRISELEQRAGVGPVDEDARAAGPLHDILIEELELEVRPYNCLKRYGIKTVDVLVSKSEAELYAIPNFGVKCLRDVTDALAARGLTLAEGWGQ